MKPVYCHTTLQFASGQGAIPCPVAIIDGRRATPAPRLATHGFELIRHESAVRDWDDDGELPRYYDEITAVARDLTGCDWVVFYPAIRRSHALAAVHADYAPIATLHCDYTEAYGAMIRDGTHPYHALLRPSIERAGITSADVAAARRITTLQVWRNTGEPDVDTPICFGDTRSVAREQLAPVLVEQYAGVRTMFEAFLVNAPAGDVSVDLYTFARMQRDEVVVFRGYDEGAGHFWTPHAAFRDTSAGPRKHPRRSIEMRAICGFA